MIRVDGTLTVNDDHDDGASRRINIIDPVTNSEKSVSGGVITGGKGTQVGNNKLGGGVFVADGGTFTLNGGNIAGNTADYGGGVRVNDGATFIMKRDTEILYNKAAKNGGGICVCNANAVEINGDICNNSALAGGGIYFEGNGISNYTVKQRIQSNSATTDESYLDSGKGGGIYLDDSNVFLIGDDRTILSGIFSNTASKQGGGIYVNETSTLNIGGYVGVDDNKSGTNLNNIYLSGDTKINVTSKLFKIAYNIYVNNTGAVITNFTADKKPNLNTKPSDIFKADAAANDCVWYSKELTGEVYIGHAGGTVTCQAKATCEHCGQEYGELAAHNYVDGVCSVCADKAYFTVNVDGVITNYDTIEEAWAAAKTAGTATITMYADASLTQFLYVSPDTNINITLDLNGHTIKGSSAWIAIQISGESSTFTLKDSAGGGKITGSMGGIIVDDNATVNMESGEISGNVCSDIGGGVYIESGGTFNMSGGVISGNTAEGRGGGVYIYNGTFNMSGGTIKGNTAEYGGGVYVSNGTFNMEGGEISGNTAKEGGGVYINLGTFNMSGGTIKGNTAQTMSGGVYVGASCTFNVSGLVQIYENTIDNKANNVELSYGRKITVVDDLDENTRINVYMESAGDVATGYSQSEPPTNYFVSDNEQLNCVYNDNGTVKFAAHDFSGEYQKDETGHWHVCKNGCTQTDIKTSHTAGEWIVDTPAQIGIVGSKHKECTVCGYITETEEIPAIAPEHQHTFATEWTKDETGHWHAATCEHISQKSGFATHTASEWVIDTPAQIGVAGNKHKECTVCGYSLETAEIPALVDELQEENKVIVTTPNGFAPEIELVVTEIAKENYAQYETIANTVNGEINLVYDVTLKSAGVTIQPDGTLTIKLRIPEQLQGKNFKLFHLHGSEATDMVYTVDGNYAVVNTDRLSAFIFVGEKAIAATPADDGLSAGAIAGITIGVIIFVLLAAYVALYFTLYRKGVLKGKAFDVIYKPMNAISKKKKQDTSTTSEAE